MKNDTVTVMGLGYIGLPTGLLLANAGYRVFGFDIDKDRVDSLLKRKLPFEEKGLLKLFNNKKVKLNFKATSELKRSSYFIIAVPTPQRNRKADLSYIFKAIAMLKGILEDGNTVIVESTIGPNDCEKEIIPRLNQLGVGFNFAHCPERAIPGNTLYEMINNDRIVGSTNKEGRVKVKKLYESFVHGDIYTTSVKQAAVVKLMENTFRDVNIGLANELSLISRDLGIDIWKAIEMANKHPRVDILKPGPGVGGHCIPIDPWFLSSSSKSAKMIPLARKINDNMPKSVANKVKSIVSKHKLKDPTVGLLGYAYKKNVDDDRESPAREIQKLLSKEYRVLVNDPFVESNRAEKVELDELLKRCQVIILVTDHDVYKNIRFNKYNNVKIIYDSRNLFGRKNVSGSNAILYTLGVNVG